MTETELRQALVEFGRSLFMRGYAAGGAGNVSVRLDEQRILATPSGSCLGRLNEETLSVVDFSGSLLSGAKASKEVMFHLALYQGDPSCGSVVHLHSTWTTLLSCRADLDPEQVIRPCTPYFVMKVGKVQVIPYYPPGDLRIAAALAEWAGQRSAFLLQNHGPVVVGPTLAAAVDLMEEFEESARLDYLLRGRDVRFLTAEEISHLEQR